MWSSRRFPARKDSRRSFKAILTRPLTSFEEKIISFQRHLSSRHYKPKHLIKSKIKPLQYEVVLPAVRQILLSGQNSPEEDYRLATKNYLFHSLLRASLTYQDKKKDSVDDTSVVLFFTSCPQKFHTSSHHSVYSEKWKSSRSPTYMQANIFDINMEEAFRACKFLVPKELLSYLTEN